MKYISTVLAIKQILKTYGWKIFLFAFPGTFIYMQVFLMNIISDGSPTDFFSGFTEWLLFLVLGWTLYLMMFPMFASIYAAFLFLKIGKYILAPLRYIVYPVILLLFSSIPLYIMTSRTGSSGRGNGKRLVATIENGHLTADGWNEVYVVLVISILAGIVFAIAQNHYKK